MDLFRDLPEGRWAMLLADLERAAERAARCEGIPEVIEALSALREELDRIVQPAGPRRSPAADGPVLARAPLPAENPASGACE